MSADTATRSVDVYAVGICYASVCCPADMPLREVEGEVTKQHPTGLDHGWMVSANPTFWTGQTNPCPCERGGERVHRLLEC